MTATEVVVEHRRPGAVHRLRVAEVERLTEDSVAVTFDVPDHLREEYDFLAGQHVSVRTDLAGDDVRRSYSVCAPAGAGVLRIAVKRLPGGAFSAYAIADLRPGDELDVMTPSGRFAVRPDPASARRYAAFAAGSGITPVLSIVATVLAEEPASQVSLVYGNRTSRSVMFLEELEDLKDRYLQRLQLVHVLSREAQEPELLCGRLDHARVGRIVDALLPVDEVDEWFLCGPYAMVVGAREALLARGADRRHVHSELFHVGDAPLPRPEPAPDAAVTRVRAVLDGRRTDFDLAPGAASLLDGLLAVRADAPYACKGGVCGTCRARVVEGQVDMRRNFALEDDEVAAGYVLTCQSLPTSAAVLLDYDA
jgi:ring-1,2-phenylacetyl-CoA epoxidase subunit PaaE